MTKSTRRKTFRLSASMAQARKMLQAAQALQQAEAEAPLPPTPQPTLRPPVPAYAAPPAPTLRPPVPAYAAPAVPKLVVPEPAKRKKNNGLTYCFEERPLTQDITDANIKDMMKDFEKNRTPSDARDTDTQTQTQT